MRWLVFMLLLGTWNAGAACWKVEGLSGSSYAERNGYSREDDSYGGKFTIMINPDYAVVLYDGLNGGGMVYKALSSNVVLGLTTEPGKHAMETWVIQDDGTVLMTKTTSGFGGFDSAKALVGKVTGRCN